MNKSEVIRTWWEERLKHGAQLCEYTKDLRGVKVPLGHVWHRKIESELLWICFENWLENNPTTAEVVTRTPFMKSSFMLMFYRVSGAKRGRSRIGQSARKMVYVSIFQSLSEHKLLLLSVADDGPGTPVNPEELNKVHTEVGKILNKRKVQV